MARIAVALTEASGAVYGMRLTEQLVLGGHDVVFIATAGGVRTCARELQFEMPLGNAEAAAVSLATFLELPSATRLHVVYGDEVDDAAIGDVDAIIAAPASAHFCASLSAGLASDAPLRAAQAALSRRRPLVLVPAQSPLSLIHLRVLNELCEAGALIVPAAPTFETSPRTIDDLIVTVAATVLDVLGIEHQLHGI